MNRMSPLDGALNNLLPDTCRPGAAGLQTSITLPEHVELIKAQSLFPE